MKKSFITTEKVFVHCPFCLADTNRWQLTTIIWTWNTRFGYHEPADKHNKFDKLENTVLQSHISDCNTVLSDKQKMVYGLL